MVALRLTVAAAILAAAVARNNLARTPPMGWVSKNELYIYN